MLAELHRHLIAKLHRGVHCTLFNAAFVILQIPPLLIDTLNLVNEEMFYSGCVIAEVRDYRIAACADNYETRYVLLQPTQQVCSTLDAVDCW